MRAHYALLILFGWTPVGAAADLSDYEERVKPLFSEKCGSCHGALKQEAGLRLDAGSLIRSGGDSGTVLELGQADQSLLIERVASADPDERMPPEGAGEPLTVEQIAILRGWINAGAPFPDDETIPGNPREHWAYQPPNRPDVPAAENSLGSHPIDAFIQREHRRLNLTATAEADRATLLRRLYFDLIGLPPNQDELSTFLRSSAPDDQWEKIVDTLLENPHYGERWGRHWMDVWRYSDWDGYKNQLRGSQRHIWHWRDWIIRSLNDDKGYDQMVVEMLAGDEVAPTAPQTLAATGFLARNYHNSNRNIWLDATVEHTAKAFLGVTLNCARCHDHKYDPIPQVAYYQFRAIFEPHQVRTDRVPGQLDVARDGIPRVYDASLDAETFVFLQGNDKLPDKDNPVMPAGLDILGGKLDVQPVALPTDAYLPGLRAFVVEDQLNRARNTLNKAQRQLDELNSETDGKRKKNLLERRRAVAQLEIYSIEKRAAADRAQHLQKEKTVVEEAARTAAAVERQLLLEKAELLVLEADHKLHEARADKESDPDKQKSAEADARKALIEAQKSRAELTNKEVKDKEKYTALGKVYPAKSTGRRLALARWITDRKNPLTARVAVNHIWMRHFGAPLVDNVFDFGLRSPRPRHADLLDWLAVELMENDWRMKHIHKLIVTSRTWRQRSSAGTASSENADRDPDNLYLWRMNVRRLDAELVRDNLLAVSGELDKSMGGADIDFRKGEDSQRRSIYLRHAYEKQMTMLVLFDAASPNECYRRSESIVPQQALALANSPLSLKQARLLARKLWDQLNDSNPSPTAFVEQAFLRVLSRPPAPEEHRACLQFLTEQAQLLSATDGLSTFRGGTTPHVEAAKEPQARARENLVHVLMNHNDFVTVR